MNSSSFRGLDQRLGPDGTPVPPVIPFRPLSVGNLFSGTFAAIGLNPSVMFTVSLVTMSLMGVFAGLVSVWVGPPLTAEMLSSFADDSADVAFASGPLTVWQLLSDNAVSLLTAGASLLVTGALVLVVTSEVIGRKLSLADTSSVLRPVIWKLVGTALLVWLILFAVAFGTLFLSVLFALLLAQASIPRNAVEIIALPLLAALAIVLIWLGVRFYYAPVVAVVEAARPAEALKRSWALTSHAFWRTFGRSVLMGLTVGFITAILTSIVAALAVLLSAALPAGLVLFLSAFTSLVVSGAVMPISASYTSLMYVDQRIRSEGMAPALEDARQETLRSQTEQ